MTKLADFDVRPVSRLFKVLGDETRVRIVSLLSHGELCVCHLQEALGLAQPHISRHLAVLRAAGVVKDRRNGTWVYYRLLVQEDPESDRQLAGLVKSFASRAAIRQQVRSLLKACGPGACR